MGPSYICEDAVIKDDKELNDVVCAAYKMGCDQTREVYQKRVEKLEAALREIADFDLYNDYSNAYEIQPIARKALDAE
jgi:hypothetical protein